MLSENDLRDALQDNKNPRRSLSTDAILRRGHRRRVVVQSAAGAGTLGVVGVIGVTGLALSGRSNPSSAVAQPGGQPGPAPSSPLLQSAAPSPTASATAMSIPLDGGTVAYSLGPEPLLHNANGILLDVAGADGSQTVRVDGAIPADATKASWWSGKDQPTGWIVYGAVPAGATRVQAFVDGKPVDVATTHVPGATALAFTLLGKDTVKDPTVLVSKLTYVDVGGNTVTALAATSQSVG